VTIVDEYTRECLENRVRRKLNSKDVGITISKLFIRRGVPDYIRSDNGPEFKAKFVRDWLEKTEVETLFIPSPGHQF